MLGICFSPTAENTRGSRSGKGKRGLNARNLLFTYGGEYTGESVWEGEKGVDLFALKPVLQRQTDIRRPDHLPLE